jgi:hypothetical protein
MITSSSVKRTAKVAVLTVAFAASGSAVAMAGTGGSTTSGNNSILGGNQISVPVSVPLNICGNALAILGDAFGGCQGGARAGGGRSGSHETTSGNNSILGGNQISVPIKVPVNVCGNSAAVLGTAASGCKGGSGTGTPPPGHHRQPPSHWHIQQPPPARYHMSPPPSRHHGGGQAPSITGITSASSLPTTGANFLGLMALAGGVLAGGAGCVLLAVRRGLIQGVLASTRRAARSVTAR